MIGNEQGCPEGAYCFSLPYVDCDTVVNELAAESAAKVDTEPEPTTSPTTSAPTTPVPTKSPVYNRFFCGETYQLAEANCMTAEPCPSGSGCSKPGESCFGISTERCVSSSPTLTPTDSGPQPTDSPTKSVAPTPEPVPTVSPITEAPVVNSMYCGASYMAALATCMDPTMACPTGGCPNGLNCYAGIECVTDAPTVAPTDSGPQPTDSPTTSSAPTMKPVTGTPTTKPSPAPSKSPVVNTLFCGTEYGEAEANCSNLTACPSGTCPSGMTCYAGIQCPATASISAEDSIGSLSFGSGSTSTTPAPSPPPQSWLGVLGLSPGTEEKYCGLTPEDAANRCMTTTPCPDGKSDGCLSGQSCFTIPQSCASMQAAAGNQVGAGMQGDAADQGGVNMSPSTPQPSNAQWVANTSTSFCGSNYNDALRNCFITTACPTGFNDECPTGEGCFTIGECVRPETTSASNASTSVGDIPLTMDSTYQPSKRPTTGPPNFDFDWDSEEFTRFSGADGGCVFGLIARSFALGGVLMGALML